MFSVFLAVAAIPPSVTTVEEWTRAEAVNTRHVKPLSAAPNPAGVQFTASWMSNGTSKRMWGMEPSNAHNAPVYIHLVGGGAQVAPWISNETVAFQAVRLAAAQGFMAVLLEPIGSQLGCSHIEQNARDMFGTQATSAISVVCSRPGTDCSRGVTVHGFSEGGMQAPLAPKFNPLVTATVAWSAGTIIPGWNSSCSVLVPPAQRQCENSDVGGATLECLTDEALSQYLDRSKRRMVIGRDDTYYGGWNFGRTAFNHTYDYETQCRAGSGYTCPRDQINCFNTEGANGAGYSTPVIEHNFEVYLTNATTGAPNTQPWGLNATIYWLVTAGVSR